MTKLPIPLDVTLPFWFDRPPSEVFDIAANAEAAGARELWVGEMTTWDGPALAAAIAQTTRHLTIVLGPLAVKVRDPVALAMAAATVRAIGGRPVHLAIGGSSPVVVEHWHGRPYERMGSAMIETFQTLRPLMAGQRGPGGYRLRLEPPGGELRLAVFGPRLTRYAAQHADAVVVNMCTPAQVIPYRKALDEAAAEAGRPRPVLSTWMSTGLDPGPASVRQVAAQLVAYVAAPGYGEQMIDAGFGDLVARFRSGTVPLPALVDEIPEALVRAFGLFGSPTEIASLMADYRDAGMDHIAVAPVTAEDHGGARLLAELGRLAR